MEVSGLVLGAIPLVLEAVKNYRTVCSTLHTFRHYSREVRRVEKQFNVCRQIFLNECNLLLQIVAGQDYSHHMLADASHNFWRRAHLEEDLNKCLSSGYEACKIIISETRDMLGILEENLSSFDVLVHHKQRHEKLKSAIYRVRDSVKIAFDKSTYDENLSKLRERNSDLIALRSQIREFHKNRKDLASSSVTTQHYEAVNSASKTLHKALSDAWNCPYPGHKAHYGKLCVEAQASNALRLDIALSHDVLGDDLTQIQDRGSDHTWVYVQSVKLDETTISNRHGTLEATATDTLTDLSTALQATQHDTRGTGRPCVQDFLEDLGSNRPSKRRKVGSINNATDSPDQLNHIQDLCHEIERTDSPDTMLESGHCLGYLETPRLFKHVIYKNDRESASESQRIVNLKALLQQTQKMPAAIDPASKFKIARKMAIAILQYHSTSWLKSDWRLEDMAYFGDFQRPTEESLRTLHLTCCFSRNAELQESESTQDNQDSTTVLSLKADEEDVQLQYGINNLTLFSLGVALLEMACHQSLEVMAATNNPIIIARKLASSVRPLGSRYQRIVQQCLQCDFGQGSDLTKSELQNAIYGAIICPLDDMIESLSMA